MYNSNRSSGLSVTQRVKSVTQPRGGFIRPSDFVVDTYNDGNTLDMDTSISPAIVGMAVDYLTRFMTGTLAPEAFRISLLGATIAGEDDNAERLLRGVRGLDKKSVVNALRLAGYDVCYRAGLRRYRPVSLIEPSEGDVHNVVTMVNRGIRFMNTVGPKVADGVTFPGGYTNIVTSGDADFVTRDTLWDVTTIKQGLDKNKILQIVMYWIMGKFSVHQCLQNLDYVGVFNPRVNKSYVLDMRTVDPAVIDTIETDVLCYPKA